MSETTAAGTPWWQKCQRLESELATRTRERDEAMDNLCQMTSSRQANYKMRIEALNRADEAERKLKVAVDCLRSLMEDEDVPREVKLIINTRLREIEPRGGEVPQKETTAELHPGTTGGIPAPSSLIPVTPEVTIPEEVRARMRASFIDGFSTMDYRNAEAYADMAISHAAPFIAEAQSKLGAIEKLESLNEDGYEKMIRELDSQVAREIGESKYWKNLYETAMASIALIERHAAAWATFGTLARCVRDVNDVLHPETKTTRRGD